MSFYFINGVCDVLSTNPIREGFMNIETLIVVDADQYPLHKLNLDSQQNIYTLAASNNVTHLIKSNHATCFHVPTVKEAADTYLVIKLYDILSNNAVDKVCLLSRDKKLISMLIVTCSLYNVSVELHPQLIEHLGLDFMYSCRSICDEIQVTFLHSSQGVHDVIFEHLHDYRFGLKVKTLALHLSLSIEEATSLLNEMHHNRLVEKHGQAYLCCE